METLIETRTQIDSLELIVRYFLINIELQFRLSLLPILVSALKYEYIFLADCNNS